jgi:hypothetical protein
MRGAELQNVELEEDDRANKSRPFFVLIAE